MFTSNERVKNSKSRYIRIASQDKITGTNNRFTIDLASNGGVVDNVKGFTVHSAQVPNIFSNITSQNNRCRIFTFNTIPFPDVLIPENYYNLSDLVTTLNTVIANDIPTPGFTSTFAIDSKGFVTYTQTGTGSVFLEFTENNIFETLGFVNPGTANGIEVTNGSTVTATNPPNLIGETACYIHSRILATNNLTEADGTFSVVDKINLDKAYGEMCYTNYENDTTHQVNYFPFESKKTLRTIDINLRNAEGDLLVLPSSFYFSMMIKIFYT
jgi:hypothetical protein